MYSCKICYEDFKERDEVIVPCKCDGTMKYICKNCLSSVIKSNTNGENAAKCTICNTLYQRDISNPDVSNEILAEILYKCGSIILLVLGVFMGSSENSNFFMFMISVLMYLALSLINNLGFLGLEVMSYVFLAMSLGRAKIYMMYTGFLLGVRYMIEVMRNWDKVENRAIFDKLQNLKSKFFDFETHQYVDLI